MKRFLRRTVFFAALVLIAVTALSTTTQALTATDSYDQDWTVNAGPYGGPFPGTLLIYGTRDTDQSLACGGPLPLDGTATITPLYDAVMLSITAYKIFGDNSCQSSHWTGAAPLSSPTFFGLVSNEQGPFGVFALCFNESSCDLLLPTESQRAGDPAIGR